MGKCTLLRKSIHVSSGPGALILAQLKPYGNLLDVSKVFYFKRLNPQSESCGQSAQRGIKTDQLVDRMLYMKDQSSGKDNNDKSTSWYNQLYLTHMALRVGLFLRTIHCGPFLEIEYKHDDKQVLL